MTKRIPGMALASIITFSINKIIILICISVQNDERQFSVKVLSLTKYLENLKINLI